MTEFSVDNEQNLEINVSPVLTNISSVINGGDGKGNNNQKIISAVKKRCERGPVLLNMLKKKQHDYSGGKSKSLSVRDNEIKVTNKFIAQIFS